MTDDTKTSQSSPDAGTPAFHHRRVRASRAPTPQACGCGLPVAFDPEKHEFFCIGCGAAKLCTCRTRFPGSAGRPVNVV